MLEVQQPSSALWTSLLKSRWPRGLRLLAVGSMAVGLCLLAYCLGPVCSGWEALAVWTRGDAEAVHLQKILWHLRIPRVLLAMGIGASLAASGAALQGLFRNPLADPGLIGITAGGSVAVVLALAMVSLGWFSGHPLLLIAFGFPRCLDGRSSGLPPWPWRQGRWPWFGPRQQRHLALGRCGHQCPGLCRHRFPLGRFGRSKPAQLQFLDPRQSGWSAVGAVAACPAPVAAATPAARTHGASPQPYGVGGKASCLCRAFRSPPAAKGPDSW